MFKEKEHKTSVEEFFKLFEENENVMTIKHFDEFIEMLEKKENNEGNNKISYTSKSLQ